MSLLYCCGNISGVGDMVVVMYLGVVDVVVIWLW